MKLYINKQQQIISPLPTRRPGKPGAKSSPASACGCLDVMNGKPVLYRNAKTVLTLKARAFGEKLLCDDLVLNPGDACGFRCGYCYVGPQMIKVDKPVLAAFETDIGRRVDFQEVVIRRRNAHKLLQAQLLKKDGRPKFADPDDNRVVFGSTLVDVAANMELLRETAGLCNLILDNTAWQIRWLSKSSLLARLFKDNLIPKRHRHRMILGFSTGTLSDKVAKLIEIGTSPVSKRLAALHWLQDEGYRTFGMFCPSLPQPDGDYENFSQEICQAIRVDRCEHVWAEVLNLRGKSLARTLAALQVAGFATQAEALSAVMGPRNKAAWEHYARATFQAHTHHVPPSKLRFLQYVAEDTADWWARRRKHGAILLGKVAVRRNLTAVAG